MTSILALEGMGLALAAYATLAGALALGLFQRRLGWGLALLALGLGLAAQVVTPLGLIALTFLGLIVHGMCRSRSGSALWLMSFIVAVVMLICVMLHLVPGFHNLRVLHRVVLSPGAAPYTMYLNFDKPFMALLVLLCGGVCVEPSFGKWRWSQIAWWAALASVFAMALGLASGFIRFEPKWPDISWLWLLNNLVLVCVAEELIFRGFVLGKILELTRTRTRHAPALAIGISSLMFGAVHLPGGLTFALLAALLGVFYALAYLRSGTLIGAILVHAAINIVHFFLFTYPSVAVVRGS